MPRRDSLGLQAVIIAAPGRRPFRQRRAALYNFVGKAVCVADVILKWSNHSDAPELEYSSKRSPDLLPDLLPGGEPEVNLSNVRMQDRTHAQRSEHGEDPPFDKEEELPLYLLDEPTQISGAM